MNAIANRVKSKMNEQFNSVMSPTSDLLNLHHNSIDFINEINISNNITFDHNYSELTNSLNNSAGNVTTVPTAADSVDSEVTCLKNLLLPHLQLIQQQNEQIIIQDKHIRSLQFQNAMLKQKLRRMELRTDFNNQINNKDTLHSDSILNSDEDSYPQLEDLLPTDDIPDENFQEFPENCDNKNNITLLDIHVNENNIKEKLSDCEENTQPEEHLPVIVETEEEVVEEGFEEFEDEEFTYSEEEMGIKREQNNDEKSGYKPRSLLARNQSPSLTSSLTKLRDEFSKSVSPRATSRTGSNEDEDNNENREVEESPVLTKSEGRRGRLKKRRSKRQRLTSSTSVLSTNSSESKKLKVTIPTKRDMILTTEHMYYTQIGDISCNFGPVDDLEHLLDTGTTTTNLEVPSWRKKVFTSCYSMEGTENLDDDVFNKRHHRLEINERRRKKWDVQRIREQRHIEKLKQRQERIGSGARTDDHIEEQPVSLWPSLDNIKFIEITEQLPVTSFGCTIAQLTPSEFSLPWLNRNSDNSNIHLTKKSSRKSSTSSRRRGNKR